jgi:mono/diheme cytochrome c family protein
VKITYANGALLLAALLAGTAVAQTAGTPPAPTVAAAAQPNSKADADFALVQAHCSACHAVEQVTAARKTPDEWNETMDRMVDHGMQISPEDNKRITDFLVAHYGAK